ncbi:hypothetical protein MBOU_07620 [Mycobacterium bourgelatii]|uniref:Uncharacterized protein n=1 Tax=Mycobacterium bourgelatii TaxID=1273442 RepID=A0A7I9YJ64_MYCBU|nr:hypothetical protein MBOU_07620 [Mycobacterium bourgelatii]
MRKPRRAKDAKGMCNRRAHNGILDTCLYPHQVGLGALLQLRGGFGPVTAEVIPAARTRVASPGSTNRELVPGSGWGDCKATWILVSEANGESGRHVRNLR